MRPYLEGQWLVHEIISPAHSNSTIFAIVMQSQYNMSMCISFWNALEADWESIKTWVVVCQITALSQGWFCNYVFQKAEKLNLLTILN